jgi:20S proteasome subunit beta 2
LQREEAVLLVTEGIEAGIFNDLGSGSNVDVCVITSVTEEPVVQRNVSLRQNAKPPLHLNYAFPRGTTGACLHIYLVVNFSEGW